MPPPSWSGAAPSRSSGIEDVELALVHVGQAVGVFSASCPRPLADGIPRAVIMLRPPLSKPPANARDDARIERCGFK
jgi:hypothetical protein